MSDFITTLASKSGVNADMARNGTGALLTSLKENLAPDLFQQVTGAIPDASSLMSGFTTAKAGAKTADAASPLANLAGGLLGGSTGAASSLLNNFSVAGFSVDQLKVFMPVVLGLLKSKLSPDVMEKTEKSIPGLSSLLGAGDKGNVLSKVTSLF